MHQSVAGAGTFSVAMRDSIISNKPCKYCILSKLWLNLVSLKDICSLRMQFKAACSMLEGCSPCLVMHAEAYKAPWLQNHAGMESMLANHRPQCNAVGSAAYRLEEDLGNLEAVRTNLYLIPIWKLYITTIVSYHNQSQASASRCEVNLACQC